MDGRLVRAWVPDELWALAELLIPPQQARGAGRRQAMADPRAVLATVVSVLRTGCLAARAARVRGVKGDRAPPSELGCGGCKVPVGR